MWWFTVCLNTEISRRNGKKKRIIPVPKNTGGFLPLLFPIIGALGAIGGAVGVATSVNYAKINQKQLEEQKGIMLQWSQSYERKGCLKNGSEVFLKYPF